MSSSAMDRRQLYQMMVRQLQYDGFQDAAQAVSRSTMTTVPEQEEDGDRLSKVVAQNKGLDAGSRKRGLDQWNNVYSYFGPGEQLMTRHIAVHGREIRCIRYSPDGEYLLAADAAGVIQMYLVEKMMSTNTEAKSASMAALARVYDESSFSIEDILMHPTAPIIISGGRDGCLRLFHYSRPRTRKSARILRDEFAIRAMAIHPLGQHLLAGCEHPVIRLWDIEFQRVFRAPDDICDITNPNAGIVNAVDFTPDGRTFASGHSDGSLKLWDPSASRWMVVPIPNCHSGAEVTSVQFSKTGTQLLTAGKDACVRVFDIRTYKCLSVHGRPRQIQHRAIAKFTAHEECIASILDSTQRMTLIDRNMTETVEIYMNKKPAASPAPGAPPKSNALSSRVTVLCPSPRAPFIATGDSGFKLRLWTPHDPTEQTLHSTNLEQMAIRAAAEEGQ